jgi:uncharacterized membrane protein YphA (DoxX/SURF4 family)
MASSLDSSNSSPNGQVAVAWRRALDVLAGFLLGGTWLFAAYSKILDPLRFSEVIRDEGLGILFSSWTVALAAVGLETFLGLALVLGARARGVTGAASLLVAFLLFLTGRNWWYVSRGLRPQMSDCGCFGNLVERTPRDAFLQDAILMVLPLLVLITIRIHRSRLFLRLSAAGLGALAAVLAAVQSPRLALDDLATRLRPGVRVEDLCQGPAGGSRVCLDMVAPELSKGSHVAILADLGDGFGQKVPRLNEYTRASKGPRLCVITASSSSERFSFFWKFGPQFEIVEAPRELLRPLYRRLPRSFLVEEGRVRATFDGLPPLGVTQSRVGEH